MNRFSLYAAWMILTTLVFTLPSAAQQPPPEKQAKQATEKRPTAGEEPDAERSKVDPAAEAAEPDKASSSIVRLTKDGEIWIDTKKKTVIIGGQVVLREGQLEMFACPKGTKEHESVVSVNSKASYVHAALLAVGAEPGKPVQYDPEYVPAKGPKVDVLVLWEDEQGKRHQVPAQQWIRHIKTRKALNYPWVFAGSGFWVDEVDGRRYYHGDAGDFICVSNFPSATLDLPVASSQENSSLLYEAFTENIPPVGTKVRLVLVPQSEKKK